MDSVVTALLPGGSLRLDELLVQLLHFNRTLLDSTNDLLSTQITLSKLSLVGLDSLTRFDVLRTMGAYTLGNDVTFGSLGLQAEFALRMRPSPARLRSPRALLRSCCSACSSVPSKKKRGEREGRAPMQAFTWPRAARCSHTAHLFSKKVLPRLAASASAAEGRHHHQLRQQLRQRDALGDSPPPRPPPLGTVGWLHLGSVVSTVPRGAAQRRTVVFCGDFITIVRRA